VPAAPPDPVAKSVAASVGGGFVALGAQARHASATMLNRDIDSRAVRIRSATPVNGRLPALL
jgi:hypothetical protein